MGPERSGTTWIATALCKGAGARYVHEPDSPGVNPLALHEPALSRYPVLEVGEDAPELEGYVALWDLAFSGSWPLHPVPGVVVDAFSRLPDRFEAPLTLVARRLLQRARGLKLQILKPTVHSDANRASGRRSRGAQSQAPVLVKTVYAMFALEWLVERYHPDAVVVVHRDPLAVAASLSALGTGADREQKLRHVYEHPVNRRRFVEHLGLPPLPEHLDVIEACAWWAAFTTAALLTMARHHPEWIVVKHDSVLDDPRHTLDRIVARLGGTHTGALERFVYKSGRPGRGYSTKRVASEVRERWRTGLEPEEQHKVTAIVERFPLST